MSPQMLVGKWPHCARARRILAIAAVILFQTARVVVAQSANGQFLDTYYSGVLVGCEVTATQTYTLDKASNRQVLQQTWRFDNTGVWRQ